MSCSQTLKNDTLTHPSLWADYSYKIGGSADVEEAWIIYHCIAHLM